MASTCGSLASDTQGADSDTQEPNLNIAVHGGTVFTQSRHLLGMTALLALPRPSP